MLQAESGRPQRTDPHQKQVEGQEAAPPREKAEHKERSQNRTTCSSSPLPQTMSAMVCPGVGGVMPVVKRPTWR